MCLCFVPSDSGASICLQNFMTQNKTSTWCGILFEQNRESRLMSEAAKECAVDFADILIQCKTEALARLSLKGLRLFLNKKKNVNLQKCFLSTLPGQTNIVFDSF